MMSSSSNQKANGPEQKTGAKRLRRSADEKRQIAEASLKPGASVQQIAQAYGVHPSQIGKWRRLYRSELLGHASEPALLAVHIADDLEQDATKRTVKPQRSQTGIIYIELARARVSIEGGADAATVRTVLECLAG
jgi:transposase-like protein